MEESLHRHTSILIVDDDPFVCSLLSEILESEGYRVKTAANGKDGLAMFCSEKDIELLISDIHMPEMDGIRLIKTLRAQATDVPVIILTVNDEIRVALEAIRSGATDYILKNENIEDTVLISVKNALENYRLKKQNAALMEELKRKNQELERLSMRDGLTGVLNRRHYNRIIEVEWKRAVREGTDLSLLMIEIEYFKRYNDRYGHLEGDDCLRRVARTLSDTLKRPADRLFRYGGEEFAAVLPATGMSGAVKIAESMRCAVTDLNIDHELSETASQVTVSIGAASIRPGPNDDYTPFVNRADQALYTAKAGGRNRVVSAEADQPIEAREIEKTS